MQHQTKNKEAKKPEKRRFEIGIIGYTALSAFSILVWCFFFLADKKGQEFILHMVGFLLLFYLVYLLFYCALFVVFYCIKNRLSVTDDGLQWWTFGKYGQKGEGRWEDVVDTYREGSGDTLGTLVFRDGQQVNLTRLLKDKSQKVQRECLAKVEKHVMLDRVTLWEYRQKLKRQRN
jgi:hypothetical protein